MTAADRGGPVVEVRPEVMFLSELLDELTKGKIRIPRFQRPFVWRRDQMTDLLDSVYNQYPIGSLLVWETDVSIATLPRLGPFSFPTGDDRHAGYLLDGHQRLSTLAGALVARDGSIPGDNDQDSGRWNLAWNMQTSRFQHGRAEDQPGVLFPLTSLLDTLLFFEAVDTARKAIEGSGQVAEARIQELSRVARAFQHYRVPVIRIRQTGLSEAVEIFARLNSKGQSMSADQMVSALMYNQDGDAEQFDLASKIDEILMGLGEKNFGDVDRTAILRAILANLDEDIYRTDWTRLASTRRKDLGAKLHEGVKSATASLGLALDFLHGEGVKISRLLPYSMQLVVLSAFFDKAPRPTKKQYAFLQRWFWVSSFSGWFGGANPSRVNSLVAEFRTIAENGVPGALENFDLEASALPYPANFDMRSARTRALLLVMLSLQPREVDGTVIEDPWFEIAKKGPSAVGHIVGAIPKEISGNPANRMIRPPHVANGYLWRWVQDELSGADDRVLRSHSFNREALRLLEKRKIAEFVQIRQGLLVDAERRFQRKVGVTESSAVVGDSPIDTE
ncbi:DUF262 domain-containing protein [Amycolatopsis sp. cg9]|uniref:DUF262 domain-containing protein n=1 Tax=Amycolatopsis sp. cg9 TaxID=3238801 RepID=UPI003523A485